MTPGLAIALIALVAFVVSLAVSVTNLHYRVTRLERERGVSQKEWRK